MNNAPTDIQLSNTTILDSGIYTLIGTLTTTDPDAGDTFTYQVSQVWNGYGYYSFEPVGKLYVYGGNTPGTYSVKVRATDQGGLFVEKILTFSIVPDYKYFTGGDGDDVLDVPQYTRHAIIDGGAGTDTVIAHSGFYAEQMTNVEILDVRDQGSRITLTQAQFDGLTQITSTTNEQILVRIDIASSVDFSAKFAASHSVDAEFGRAGAVTGTDGNDSIWVTGGSTQVDGGAGSDTLTADRGATIVISGGDGNDTITLGSNGSFAGTSSVTLSGGAGADSFTIANGLLTQGTVDGGAGLDRVVTALAGCSFVNVEEWYHGYFSPYTAATATVAQAASFSEITSGGAGVNIALKGAGGTLDLSASLAAGLQLILSAADMTSGIEIHGGDSTNWIDGSGFADSIFGGAAKDYLKGGAGDDTVHGGLGDDELSGFAGADVLFGGNGNDRLDGGADVDDMNGGAGDDTFVVDSSADQVREFSNGGVDTVETAITYMLTDNVEKLTIIGSADVNGTGNSGDNVLTGNSGANMLDGGDGNDTLQGYGGQDSLNGGAGDDAFLVSGGERIDGGAGIDRVLVARYGAYLVGATLSNLEVLEFQEPYGGVSMELSQFAAFSSIVAAGGHASFQFYGLGRTANLAALLGNTVSASIDAISLTSAVEITLGGGNDIMTGTYYADKIFGGAGDDTIDGYFGNDLINGGAGSDTLSSSSSGAQLLGGAGNDKLAAVYGAAYLDGGAGDDMMTGGYGDQRFIVDSAGDHVVETYSDMTTGGIDRVFAGVSYTLSANVETLRLTGSAAINGFGNVLANSLTGNGGDNVLDGRGGIDVLIGGLGKDTFAFSTPIGKLNADFIADFSSLDDTIRLENTGVGRFNALAVGALSADAFHAAAGAVRAHDASDRIVYNTTNGALYYDADGLGGADAIRFATLKGAPTLTNADFVVV